MTKSGAHAQGTVISITWLIVAISLAIAGILVVQYYYATRAFSEIGTMQHRGQFGDIFGGVNAFFTGLAFAGVLFTIFLQRKELEWQRNELSESNYLSALSALMSAYGTRLAPYWTRQTTLQLEVARCTSDLASAEQDLSRAPLPDREPIEDRKQKLTARRKALRQQLAALNNQWGVNRGQQLELISELENKVKEARKTNRAR